MSGALSPAVGAAVAAAAAMAGTPLAIGVARRFDFYDHPREYRRHTRSTPLLGGAAVIGAVIVAAAAIGASGKLLVLLSGALVVWTVGTIDDRVAVAPKWRLVTETGVALILVSIGLKWTAYGSGGDAVLTVIWVVGLVNAFNLMDNLDGACGSVASVSAAGIGTLAVLHREFAVAGLAFALSAACAVFLLWNLAGPARIFLGDGGSRPIGLLIAGLAMAAVHPVQVGRGQLLIGALMAGLVILDTALVTVSRTRRGVTLVTGGRDHTSHRLLLALHSPRRVAAALALAQAVLCAFALGGDRWGGEALDILASIAILAGVVVIGTLDSPRWRPAGIAVAAPSPALQRGEVPTPASQPVEVRSRVD